MTPLPPPDLNTLTAAPNGPAAPSTRRRLALAVAVAGTLGIGGAAASSQLASASTPVGETAAPNAALDVDDLEVPSEHVDDVDWDAIDEEFEAYDSCLAEQLPDLFSDESMILDGELLDEADWDDADWDEFEDIDMSDSISIFTADENGDEEWTVLDLGDEDSTITITKNDGEIEIVTAGDVEKIDLGDVEVSPDDEAAWEAEMEQFDAAHEACSDLMPDLAEFEEITFADDVFDDDSDGAVEIEAIGD